MNDSRSQLTLRQRLVAEIGAEGQARIAGRSSRVAMRGLAGEIEARYLACAGFASLATTTEAQAAIAKDACPTLAIELAAAASPPSGSSFALEGEVDSAVRALLDGALSALRQIREAAR
jgi:hypothetical protein